MLVTLHQLKQVMSFAKALSTSSFNCQTDLADIKVKLTNTSHQTYIDEELISFTKETGAGYGMYCLGILFKRKDMVTLKAIQLDNTTIQTEGMTQIQLVTTLQQLALTAENVNTKRMLVILKKDKSRIELNMFNDEHIYRKYVSPDNKSIIIFKNSINQTTQQLKDYSIESVNLFNDSLTEKKFRDYHYDSANAVNKTIKYVDTYKEEVM